MRMGGVLGVVADAADQLAAFLTHVAATVGASRRGRPVVRKKGRPRSDAPTISIKLPAQNLAPQEKNVYSRRRAIQESQSFRANIIPETNQ